MPTTDAEMLNIADEVVHQSRKRGRRRAARYLAEQLENYREAAIAEDRRGRTFTPDDIALAVQRELVAWLRSCDDRGDYAANYADRIEAGEHRKEG